MVRTSDAFERCKDHISVWPPCRDLPSWRGRATHGPRMCVYACRHPLWGGAGTCVADETAEQRAWCSCTAGFSDVDSMDNPSCVPKLALLIGYLAVTITGTATFAFLVASAYRHCARRASVYESSKAVTKLRLILLSRYLLLVCMYSMV